MPSLYAQKKSDGQDPQRGRSSRKKERNVPLMEGSLNANLRLSYSSKKTEVILKNGMGVLQGVKTIVRLKNGASSGEV
jgi:hypothetical protein